MTFIGWWILLLQPGNAMRLKHQERKKPDYQPNKETFFNCICAGQWVLSTEKGSKCWTQLQTCGQKQRVGHARGCEDETGEESKLECFP